MAKFNLVGISDETVCECCGKQNLKRTVVLAVLDAEGNEGEFVKFGRDCAARALANGRKPKTAARMEGEAVFESERRRRAELDFVHQIGEARSVQDWFIVLADPTGRAKMLGRANGLKPAVLKWAEAKFGKLSLEGLEVLTKLSLQSFRIEY